MSKLCVLTGAGSGVGRAVAIKLVGAGWRVALLGRRAELLQETATLAKPGAQSRLLSFPCNIGDPEAVRQVAERIAMELGQVDALVNSAGTNVPCRSLEQLSLADYHEMINTNLHGAYYCAQAFLPQMRARGRGTIINVVSDAGKYASPKAGPAYVMSKFGLAGLTQSINAEERARGIRACAIFPGDIDTPLLLKRPEPPGAEARARMMRPEDVADCILFCMHLPENVVVEELLIRPR